jgi:EpsD family peptidyl-prolyl cis-trans isomerase
MIRSVLKPSRARASALALAAMAVVAMTACGQKKDVASGVAGTGDEIVAKVNGDEISAGQLAVAMQKMRGMRPDAGEAESRPVLDNLVKEQIVAQKAVAAKLDKDPMVLQQLEAARRDILARRFIEAAAETSGKPTDEAVQKFYDSRSNLFARRKVFTLQRLDIQAPDDRRTEVDAHVQSLKTPGELADWLKSQKLPFTTKQEQDPSEQLPPVVLDRLAAMKDGESTVVPSQSGVSALTLVSSASAPKSLADARPAIEQFLANQGRGEVMRNLQKTICDGAKVQYVGRFASIPPACGEATVPAAVPTVPASASASAIPQNSPSVQK